jgi:hypothetical protein
MRSVRELIDEVTEIRMNPTSVSQWHALVSIQTRARALVADALAIYDYAVQGIDFSVPASTPPCAIALPKGATRVRYVKPAGATDDSVVGWEHYPTPATNLLNITSWTVDTVPTALEVGYEMSSVDMRVPLTDLTVVGTVSSTDTTLQVGAGDSLSTWPPTGFVELYNASGEQREVVAYGARNVTTRTFTGLLRGVEGEPMAFSTGTIVSLVLPAPNAAIPVWVRHAQAQFYDALVADRAFYDKYTAIASEQAMPPAQLAMLARNYEDKAERTFKRTRRVPKPGQHKARRLRR